MVSAAGRGAVSWFVRGVEKGLGFLDELECDDTSVFMHM